MPSLWLDYNSRKCKFLGWATLRLCYSSFSPGAGFWTRWPGSLICLRFKQSYKHVAFDFFDISIVRIWNEPGKILPNNLASRQLLGEDLIHSSWSC